MTKISALNKKRCCLFLDFLCPHSFPTNPIKWEFEILLKYNKEVIVGESSAFKTRLQATQANQSHYFLWSHQNFVRKLKWPDLVCCLRHSLEMTFFSHFSLNKTLTKSICHAWKEALKTAPEVSLKCSVQCFEGKNTHLNISTLVGMFRKDDHLCSYLENLHMDGYEQVHVIYILTEFSQKLRGVPMMGILEGV